MPRANRPHEEHLEKIEPVGLVILNDVSYLVQDISEMLLDLGKLLRHRRAEVLEFAEKAKKGPEGFAEILPAGFLPFLMGAGMTVVGKAMEVKAGVGDMQAEGGGTGGGPLGKIDLTKAQPEMLEGLGQVLRQQADMLESMIADFEKKLLDQQPPA
jgi:hypothetical protein